MASISIKWTAASQDSNLPPSVEQYLTIIGAAKFLKISGSKMQVISASRLVPVHKPTNGKIYFKPDDLLHFIASSRIEGKGGSHE